MTDRNTVVTTDNGSGSIFFILGALVVGLVVLFWVMSGKPMPSAQTAPNDVNVTITAPEAPATPAPSN